MPFRICAAGYARYVALGMMHNEIAHWALPLPGLGGNRLNKKEGMLGIFYFWRDLYLRLSSSEKGNREGKKEGLREGKNLSHRGQIDFKLEWPRRSWQLRWWGDSPPLVLGCFQR